MTGRRTSWNGHRFFGLRPANGQPAGPKRSRSSPADKSEPQVEVPPCLPRWRSACWRRVGRAMKRQERETSPAAARFTPVSPPSMASSRSSTRSTTSARRPRPTVFLKLGEGWSLIRNRYDDGGFSGGIMERPALKKLLDDVRARRIGTSSSSTRSTAQRGRSPTSPSSSNSAKVIGERILSDRCLQEEGHRRTAGYRVETAS